MLMVFFGIHRATNSKLQKNKMKIEPAIISFKENTISSRMAGQTDHFIAKENCKSLCFLKIANG